MKIGELAQKGEVTEQTIRYYERLGLLTGKREKKRGFRHFTSLELGKLKLIKGLQSLQLPLDKIVALFQIWRESPTGEAAHHRFSQALKSQIEAMEARLSDWLALKGTMSAALEVSAHCQGCQKKPVPETCLECPRLLNAGERAEAIALFF